MPNPAYRYTAVIGRWVDADTVDVSVRLGWHVEMKVRVRLQSLTCGLDAPERRTAAGKAAHQRAEALAPAGTEATLHSHELDKYGRSLGALVLDTGLDVGAELIAEGHALPWDGAGPKPNPLPTPETL